jgi:hypothetical protein
MDVREDFGLPLARGFAAFIAFTHFSKKPCGR